MSEEDNNDKPHEATPRKLEEARKKGELPKVADLTATASVAGFLLLSLLPGGWIPMQVGEIGAALLDRADLISRLMLGGGTGASDALLKALFLVLAPLFLVPMGLVLLTLIAMRGLVFAPTKLEPKLSRIDPISNAKQKFGPSGLFEFGKNSVKLVIYGTVLWLFLSSKLTALLGTIRLSAGQVSAAMMEMIVEFLGLVVLIMLIMGGIDYCWQYFDHLRRQRMSHQELKDEFKQSEGDPHTKGQRQMRGREIAMNQAIADVPKADVVIVNPTHYAVALKWERGKNGAPVCVAKGVDEVALKIREVAKEAGVPIHADPPTARALHATTEVGQEVSPDHYAPVAAAIRFAELMRQKARARGAGPSLRL